ncbi:hypothetical protein HYC85_019618 [Camellia sinensis]|uniref:Uncharacterized protein n=1 Tax=Camellia sinensis TaxID=4442 RepID=A0A7J7GR44_CAMSI|nr:hypothetical protein HYC85_019618 [Camellia sinensis]
MQFLYSFYSSVVVRLYHLEMLRENGRLIYRIHPTIPNDVIGKNVGETRPLIFQQNYI